MNRDRQRRKFEGQEMAGMVFTIALMLLWAVGVVAFIGCLIYMMLHAVPT